MVSYKELNLGDPLAYVFQANDLNWLAGIVSFSAIIATASVLLVFQLGQPRIWMSMSRDGLLPPIFSRIHPKYGTPSFSTLLTGLVVGIPALFMNLSEVVALCSVGTLFAFVLVCAGILRLQHRPDKPQSRFKTPYINGKWIVPALFILALVCFQQFSEAGIAGLFSINVQEGKTSWDAISEKIPYVAFGILFLIVALLSFIKNYSLIPVMGLLSCSYLLCESGVSNWERFLIWLVIGLVIYFLYGAKHSKLRKKEIK